MTKLGLGGAFLDQSSHDEGIALIRHALASGITYIDTSPMYMQGRSQALIGQALAALPHSLTKNLTLATKLGYLPTLSDFHHPDKLLAQFEQNQTLLAHPISLLQLHEADLSRWWTTNPDAPFRIDPTTSKPPDFKNAPAFKTLLHLKNSGKVPRIGISGNDAPAMSAVFDALPVDSLLLAFNYTLIHRAARDHALPAAVKRNIPFINAGPLYCGRLAVPNPAWLTTPPHWLLPHELPKYKALYDLADHTHLSLPELTVRYLLADPRIHLTLFGPSSRHELDTLLTSAAKGPLPPDLHKKVEALSM